MEIPGEVVAIEDRAAEEAMEKSEPQEETTAIEGTKCQATEKATEKSESQEITAIEGTRCQATEKAR